MINPLFVFLSYLSIVLLFLLFKSAVLHRATHQCRDKSFPSLITDEKDTDAFWAKLYNYKHDGCEIVPFKELAKFSLSVLLLPHSNADCERMFSKINRTNTTTRNRMITSTVSATLMACELLSNSHSTAGKKVTCITFEPTKKMFKLMNSDNLYQNDNETEALSSSLFHSGTL